MEQVIGGAPAAAGAQAVIKDTNVANFARDVLDASRDIPVIVDFWAPWCGPCKQLTPILEKIVREARGAVQLVKLNIDEAPQIAQQMRIQSIPAVYAFFQGRPVDGFMGAVPESQVKAFVGRLTELAGGGGPSPVEEALEQAKAALDAGNAAEAASIYSQVLQHEPGNVKAIAGLGRSYLASGQVEAADGMLSSVPDGSHNDPDVAALRTALELAIQAQAASGEIPGLEARVAADPNDHQARIDLATAYFAQGASEKAIDMLLESLRRNRGWNEGAARQQLVKMFEALGGAHPDTVQGRQKMASILFA